jgi:hypothetical protein
LGRGAVLRKKQGAGLGGKDAFHSGAAFEPKDAAVFGLKTA